MSVPIKSPRNPRLTELRKLRDRKHRGETDTFTAEGEDMLAEAHRSGRPPLRVFYDADRLEASAEPLAGLPASVERIPVAGEAMQAASALGSGSRVIGVWKRSWRRPEPAGASPDVVLYLHDVADPGNVGAVMRSAFALVPDAVVVLSPAAADPFGPKAVRASMGAIFGQPVVRATFERTRNEIAASHRAVALVPGAGTPLRSLELEGPTLFLLGAEREGLPDSIVAACEETAHVPLAVGGAESLNVAMAATLCLYEIAVHRLSATRG
jgi:RNA methyltransferase, TrmH family